MLSTKKRYTSFLKMVFVFQKICFYLKVLKSFKISTDCHIKTRRSLKWRAIWSLRWRAIWKSLVLIFRRIFSCVPENLFLSYLSWPCHLRFLKADFHKFYLVHSLWWWWIVFVVWLTDERRLALFPAGTIIRDHHNRESPTRRKQGFNLRRTWVQA